MGIDSVIKRYWIVVLAVFVAVTAYLQAEGVGQLVAGTIGDGQEVAAPKARPRRPLSTTHHADRNAAPILSRNAFDSVTGPLDGKSQSIGALPPVEPKNENNPYDDRECEGVTVSLMIASDDPAWSFASISGPEGSSLHRVGDKIGSMTVHHVGWYPDGPDALPRVWMMDGASRCVAKQGAGDPKKAPKKTASTTPPPAASSSSKSKSKVPSEIASKITKVSDTEFIVERSALESIMENPMSFAGTLRTRPTDKGVRLSGIRSDSLFNMLGLKNGDVLKSVNGFELNDPEKALGALAKLRTASKLSLDVERGGQPKAIGVTVH